MTKNAKRSAKKTAKLSLPPAHDWRTTDTDEINKRRQRAREESFVITNATPAHPIFSNFRVQSASGLTYSVEVRSLAARQFACDCVDFRINGLGVAAGVTVDHFLARFVCHGGGLVVGVAHSGRGEFGRPSLDHRAQLGRGDEPSDAHAIRTLTAAPGETPLTSPVAIGKGAVGVEPQR
jgi:hypothetical protein